MKHKKYPKFEDYDFSDCREITGDELYRINGGGRIQPEQNENPPEGDSSNNSDSYTVQSGDTLSQIVYDYNQANGTHLTVDEVAALSGIENPDLIHPGQSIVFGDSSQGADPVQTQTGDPVQQIPGGHGMQSDNPSVNSEISLPKNTDSVESDFLGNVQNSTNTSNSGWGHLRESYDNVYENKDCVLSGITNSNNAANSTFLKNSNIINVQYSKSNEIASDYDRLIDDENEKLTIIKNLGNNISTFRRIPTLAEEYLTTVKKMEFVGGSPQYGNKDYSEDTPEKAVKNFFSNPTIDCRITEKTFSYYDSKPTWNYEQTSRGYEYFFSRGNERVYYYDINKDGWIDFTGEYR